jgi:hypothetical protein
VNFFNKLEGRSEWRLSKRAPHLVFSFCRMVGGAHTSVQRRAGVLATEQHTSLASGACQRWGGTRGRHNGDGATKAAPRW